MKTLACILLTFFVAFTEASSQISLNQLNTTYSETFNTLLSSGSATWNDNSTLQGWYHSRTGTGTTYLTGTGSSNTGGLYSFGSAASSDRALGGVPSSNATVGALTWGVRLVNNTGQTVNSITVSYYGEQWRVSGVNASQTISFYYQIGSNLTSLTAGTWSPNTFMDFASPVPNGSAAALDGNAAANRVLLSQTFSVTIAAGEEIMLRWVDIDHAGADHGMAIDDFSVSFSLTLLPVELVNFRAQLRNDIVELRWKTVTEKNNFGFEVQRKAGNGAWADVGFVAGQGTSNTPTEYAYNDAPPKEMLLRYRLRQVDRDGTVDFSPELRILREPISSRVDLTLAPNPLQSEGVLSVTLSESREVDVSVCNIIGARVMNVYEGPLEAGSHFFSLRMQDQIPGEYLLMYRSAGEVRVVRFVKMH